MTEAAKANGSRSTSPIPGKRFTNKLKPVSDCHTRCEDTFQQNTINARAAIVAGSPERYAWVCERDGHLTIRSVRTGAVMKAITRAGVFPWALAEGPLQRRVWVGYSDGCIILFSSSPPHQQVMVLESGPGTGGCYCLLRHLDFVFAGYGNCQVIKWDTTKIDSPNQGREGYYIGHTGGHGMAIRGLALNLNTLYTCADDMAIRKWDVATCDQLKAFKGHEASVLAICFVAKNNRLWSCSEDRTVRVWDPDQSEALKTFHMDAPAGVMRHYGNRVWVGCWDKKVILFDSKNVEKVGVYANHNAPITDVVAVAESKLFTVWTCGADRCVKSWHVETKDHDFMKDEQDAQRQIVELQTEVEALNHLLGRKNQKRSNSCWNIDDVAYCSTQVAREFRDRITMLEADNAQMVAAQRERREQTVVQFVQRAQLVQQNLLHRYFNTLFKHWASQAGKRARLSHSKQELTLLGKVNFRLAGRFYWKLWRYARACIRRAGLRIGAERLLQQTSYGCKSLAYHRLALFAETKKKQRNLLECLGSCLPWGIQKVAFQKLYKNAMLARNGVRNKAIKEAMRRQLQSCAHKESLWPVFHRLAMHGARAKKPRGATAVHAAVLVREGAEKRILRRAYNAFARHAQAAQRRRDAVRAAGVFERMAALNLQAATFRKLEAASKQQKRQAAILRSLRMIRLRADFALMREKLHLLLLYKQKVQQTALRAKHRKAQEEAEVAKRKLAQLNAEHAALKYADNERKGTMLELQGLYDDSLAKNLALEQELRAMRRSTEELQVMCRSYKLRFQARPLNLLTASEAYKLLNKTEHCVRQCKNEIEVREVGRCDLLDHLGQVLHCLVKVKQYQAHCLKESFSESEQHHGNVSGILHGKNANYQSPEYERLKGNTPAHASAKPQKSKRYTKRFGGSAARHTTAGIPLNAASLPASANIVSATPSAGKTYTDL